MPARRRGFHCGRSRCGAVLALQRAELAACAEHAAVGIDDGDAQAQVHGQQALVERARVDLDPMHLAQRFCERDRHGLPAGRRGHRGERVARRIGQRHERAALLFRQRTQVGDDLFAQPCRHEPFELHRPDRAEQRARHRHRDPVRVVAGLEDVVERQALARERQLVRVPKRREIAGVARRDVAERHAKLAVVTRGREAREARAVVHTRRQAFVVERRDAGLADEEITLTQSGLGREHRAAHGTVVREEFRLARLEPDRVGRERLGDEDPPRLLRLDAPVIDAPLAREPHAEQRHDLARRDLAALRIPLRVVVLEPHEVRRDVQRPTRVHLRDRAQVLPLRRDTLGGDEPARPFLRERRAGEELRARLAHAAIHEPVVVLRDEIDERREHGLMDRPVVCGLLARTPA